MNKGREIKFRVWDEIGKQMYYPESGLKSCITQIGKVCIDETDEGGILENRDYRMNALFYTGLKDKHGKEIYEGDIIENYAIRDKVIFKDGCFVLSRDMGCPTCHSKYMGMHDELEVIGNIYENGDLL